MALALVGLLAACGGLPRPFEGRPGAQGMRLAQPPPSRLAIARPTRALLPDSSAGQFADAMAAALAAQDIPAISTAPRPGDWRLALSAEIQSDRVTPVYTVFDASGEQAGVIQGQPVGADVWAAGLPATLEATATAAAPGISSLLSNIEAARRASDPNSLVNRPARLFVPEVAGAPGDGNRQLARQMRSQLAGLGLVPQDNASAALPYDFKIEGKVAAVPIAGNQTRIEIQWVISNPGGDERGRIVQLNEVPAGSLDRYWGDVALVVAQEAAGGVKDVVARQGGGQPAAAK